MSPPRPPLSVPAPSTEPTSRLGAVARSLTEADLAPQAVGVEFAGDDVRVHVKRLGVEHPVDHLLGFRAPPEWDAFGVTATGRSLPLPDNGPPAPLAGHRPVVLTFLVDRAGASTSLIVPDGDEPVIIDEPGASTAQGILADVCRRVLGLATPPPERPVSDLWSAAWLDRVVACTLDDPGRPPSWEVVAALHPAVACLVDLDPTLIDGPERTLVALGPAVAKAWTWSAARASPTASTLAASPLPCEIVEWMDDGIFSRWSLAQLPELADLRAAVAEVLPTQVLHQVDDVLRSWGSSP